MQIDVYVYIHILNMASRFTVCHAAAQHTHSIISTAANRVAFGGMIIYLAALLSTTYAYLVS